ncbi:MAG: sigma-70 family RNA polymerase sigma factor [Planctomycetes bacterium]|nr:sigma-70 family RNA polymerase sigma factor [Planctomycetota bacterium]
MNGESCDPYWKMEEFRDCIVKLAHEDRVVHAMHGYCGLSTRRIAALLNSTRRAILERLCRARQRLCHLLEGGTMNAIRPETTAVLFTCVMYSRDTLSYNA